MSNPKTAIIVGAGHRAMIYAKLALTDPDKLKIVGVADPNPQRRKEASELFQIEESMVFENAEELAKCGKKLADSIINGTMDSEHLQTSIPLLELGYDMLLEKPFATNEDEMNQIIDAARKNNCKVMICHVLRYTPFYSTIKKMIVDGEIGEIVNMQTNEHVSYHHLSTSYVRGKWANSEKCSTSMLLAKCCHDLDIIMWLMGKDKPKTVSSFGARTQFVEENAPKGAGTRCLLDCPLVDTCVYSAKRLYLDHPKRWSFYLWDELEGKENAPIDKKEELLKTTSPFGRCMFKCDNNVVDHQSVLIQFQSGATATHNMVGASAQPRRAIHIVGTKGEIFGNFEESTITLLKIDPSPDALGGECRKETINLNVTGDMAGAYGGHGGGDERLAADFVQFISGGEPSLSCTSVFDSAAGHLCVYLADKSMTEGGAPQTVTGI